jgi:hypothetical protein
MRGKYADWVAAETNVVVLEPELSEAFPNAKAVNEALRVLLDVAATRARWFGVHLSFVLYMFTPLFFIVPPQAYRPTQAASASDATQAVHR